MDPSVGLQRTACRMLDAQRAMGAVEMERRGETPRNSAPMACRSAVASAAVVGAARRTVPNSPANTLEISQERRALPVTLQIVRHRANTVQSRTHLVPRT